MGVLVDLREVELRRVPAADAVVRAEVPGDGVAVGLGLVPLGEEEHVLAVLVREPRDGHRGVQGLVLSAHKTNFTNSMATSRHTVTGGMWFGRLLVIFSTKHHLAKQAPRGHRPHLFSEILLSKVFFLKYVL